MRSRRAATSLAVGFAGLVLAAGACNSGLGDCPAPSDITTGTACSDDNLDCPWEIPAPPSCAGIMTSCVCTSGAWSCPNPTDCPSEGGAEGGGMDGGPGESGPSEASPSEGSGGDGNAGDGAAADAKSSG